MGELTQIQKLAFNFLLDHLISQEPFSKEDFIAILNAPGQETTTVTYWGKNWKPLLIEFGENRYRVSQVFRKFSTEEKFQRYISQTRFVKTEYTEYKNDNVIIFEFFMPLSNEINLRECLDALFFKDTICMRLKSIDEKKLNRFFPKREEQNQEEYFEEICSWISKYFEGYSINHVNGRFKADDLLTIAQAGEIQKKGKHYLIDETTAIVKFIFPCLESAEIHTVNLDKFLSDHDTATQTEFKNEPEKIRFLFKELFVKSILELVNGEDQIWMLESGMQNRLYIWRPI